MAGGPPNEFLPTLSKRAIVNARGRGNRSMNIEVKPQQVTIAERQLPFEVIALVLQGGGALGAYQAGVYEALSEAGIQPNWLAGTSIGAINAAIIAGNSAQTRVERLREFWRCGVVDG